VRHIPDECRAARASQSVPPLTERNHLHVIHTLPCTAATALFRIKRDTICVFHSPSTYLVFSAMQSTTILTILSIVAWNTVAIPEPIGSSER